MASLRKFHVVVAASLPEFGIGFEGKLPWRIAEDMEHFKQITSQTVDKNKQNAVIMGRKTWESIPSKFRPLPDRLNVVLTRNTNSDIAKEIAKNDNTMVASSFGKALECLSWSPYTETIENIYVIGGSQVYNESISKEFLPQLQSIYLTKVFKSFPNCDRFFKIDTTMFNCKEMSQKHKSKSDETIEYQITQLLPKAQIKQDLNQEKMEIGKENDARQGNIAKNLQQKHDEKEDELCRLE